LLASGREVWSVGERVRVYRKQAGRAALLELPADAEGNDAGNDGVAPARDPRDYDIEYYVRLLRETFAARLASAFTPDELASVFADPRQLTLFTARLSELRPKLTPLIDPRAQVRLER